MVNVVSFCLYGAHKKYCQGMIENLELMKEKFPDFQAWIYIASDVPLEWRREYLKYNTKLIDLPGSGGRFMSYRYYAIDEEEVDVMFVRDADSRVNERDEWCIKEFIKSDKKFHIIRDNYWHGAWKVTGGMWGIKKGILSEKVKILYDEYISDKEKQKDEYSSDEKFLNNEIYPKCSSSVLIHSDIIRFDGENVTPIDVENTGFNFIGNVMEYNDEGKVYPKFNYFQQLGQNMQGHLTKMRLNNSWEIIRYIYSLFPNNFCLEVYPSNVRSIILDEFYIAHYHLKEYSKCLEIYSHYRNTLVQDHNIFNSNFLIEALRRTGKRIICTTYIDRDPKENEIVIVYGNFHHFEGNLPCTNKLYRHAIYFNQIVADEWEYDPCWDKIDQIYITNLEERKDRYMELLVELCRMNAPLNRIFHYKAKKEVVTGNKNTDSNLGALVNHMDCVKNFLSVENYNHCLILEDDVTFTSRIDLHKKELSLFFERKYDFDICMITASKYWEIKSYDDLLSLSYQICTTSSGYILSRQGADKILPLFEESYIKMKQTHDTTTYAIDRYWAKIQKDNKFFLFNNKFGYQRCGYSSITGKTDCHFD